MAAVAGGPPAMERQASAVVDEDQAHAIFAEYSSGGTTISKDDLADLAFQLGEALSDEELEKVFDELDTNHDGTVDFTEFYAWLSNPAREAEDKSGYKGRLLQARLAGNYFRKRFKAIGDAMGGGDGEFKVKHDPEYVPLDLTFGVGEPGDDAPFQIEITGSHLEDGPAQPEAGNVCMSVGLLAKEGASDEDLAVVVGAVESLMEMIPPGAIPPFVTVRAEACDDLPGDKRGVRIILAVDQPFPEALQEAIEGDFDIAAMADQVKIRFAASVTPADVIEGDEGILQDLAAEFSVRGKIQKTALALASEAGSRLADSVGGGMGGMGGMGGGKMVMTPFGPQMLGPAMGMAMMGKGLSFLQSMKEITFRVITANLGEMSENLGDFAKGMVMGFSGADTVKPLLAMGVSKMMDDDDAPPPIKDMYRAVYSSIAGLNGLEYWFAGKTYTNIQMTGAELSFLPAVDNM